MNFRYFNLLIGLTVIILFSFSVLSRISINRQDAEVNEISSSRNNGKINKVQFFDESRFYAGLEYVNSLGDIQMDYVVRGGIIPHDIYPGFILSEFFYRLSFQKPKTIILIGPNHYEMGSRKFVGSENDWETKYGVLRSDGEVLQILRESSDFTINEDVIINDHSVTSALSYIKYHMPDAMVVPIVVSGYTTYEETRKFVEVVLEGISEEVVLVAAVDFSHYLNSNQAVQKDSVTLSVIESYDYDQLYMMGNDYLDSPASIGALMMAMESVGANGREILYHGNSGQLQGDQDIEVTSYFSVFYY